MKELTPEEEFKKMMGQSFKVEKGKLADEMHEKMTSMAKGDMVEATSYILLSIGAGGKSMSHRGSVNSLGDAIALAHGLKEVVKKNNDSVITQYKEYLLKVMVDSGLDKDKAIKLINETVEDVTVEDILDKFKFTHS